MPRDPGSRCLLTRVSSAFGAPAYAFARLGRLLANAGIVAEGRLVHGVRAPVLAPLVLARADGQDDAGPSPAPTMTCSVPGGQWKKSQRRQRPLLSLDDEKRLAGQHEKALLVGLPVVTAPSERRARAPAGRCRPAGTHTCLRTRSTPSGRPKTSRHRARSGVNHPSAAGASPASVSMSGASSTTATRDLYAALCPHTTRGAHPWYSKLRVLLCSSPSRRGHERLPSVAHVRRACRQRFRNMLALACLTNPRPKRPLRHPGSAERRLRTAEPTHCDLRMCGLGA